MREDEKVSHLMKGVAEDIYQALLTREINDTASFIKWCNYIEDMKQKRVGRPRFERLPNVVPVASLTDETDLVSLIRTIVREEVHRLVNQTQESLDSDPQSLEEIIQDEVERVLSPVSTNPKETRPRPTYAAVSRKYRAPVQKFPPEPRKTDVWRTADNRPVCFHCGRPGHVMRYCRERKAVFDNSRNRRRNFDDVGTEEEIRRPNSSRRFMPSPKRGRSPIRRYRSPSPYCRSSQSPGRRERGKLKRATFQGGEAACTGNPPSTAKMTGNQLDVIIDKKPIRALVDSGASFSVISDNYRRFLKMKVADGNFVRPIGKCVYVHDVILGWDFLETSQAVIDCGQNELVLEDICRDSTAPDAWNLYATRDYTLSPHSLTRITVSGYQTRGDINVVRDGSKHFLFEKNIATPFMVSTYRNGKSDVWVTNLQFRNQIIPRGMCIGQAEPLNEGHLCVISDTSGCLDDQQETSESQMNCSLMMSPELSDEQRNKLSELLRKFSGLFTKTDKSTAAKTNVKHWIFTGDHAPINQRAYRVSPTERRIIHEEVQKMLDEGIVQPSESPWSSPVVLEAGLKLNSKKCLFAAQEVKILGHLVSSNGVRPNPDKIKAVRNFPTPKNIHDIRSFLGLCSYFRRFIKGFCYLAEPLQSLLKSGVEFHWGPEEVESFNSLKKALTSDPVLGMYDERASTEIHTDASGYGIGAVLVQIQNNVEKVIAYASRTLTKAEKNYSTTERECLAIVWATNKFRPYIFGKTLCCCN
ncbi:retrovirus-related Pol polyprotein from transposon 17.6 [Trichonephila clavipes]|nr:retrovirus-related Pol polyprotein from transposon 17.6 [Trichonephila clavipes]